MTGLATLLLLALSIILHEFGHYITARRSGVAVSEFFIGFGPKIFSITRGKTEYGIKAILLGGYVKIIGMDQDEDVKGYKEDELFHNINWYRKLYISLSGILINLLLALCIIAFVLSISGIQSPTLEIQSLGQSINEKPYPPSHYAGLKSGDIIYAFDGQILEDWDSLVDNIEKNPNKIVEIEYFRNKIKSSTSVALDERIIDGTSYGYLGISPKIQNDKITIIKVITSSFILIFSMISSSITGLFTLFSPSNLLTLAGGLIGNPVPQQIRPLSPLGLAQAGQTIGDSSYLNLLILLAFVNVFLAVFNSIPLIPLDGGRAVLALIEGVTGKKISDKKLYPVAVFVILIFLFLGITALYLDITQPIKL